MLQRRRELAVRVALGATSSSVRQLVLSDATRAGGLGVGAGLLGAVALQAGLSTLIAGTEALSIWMWMAVIGGCAALVWLACWLPARRASRLELTQVLRGD